MTKERRVTFSTRRFLIGRAGPFPRLVFREDVMLHLDQFSHLHGHGEHGGFLLGKKRDLKSMERYEILVERFVPVAQADEAVRLVLTEADFLNALRESDEGEQIVGWVHTHPGFGVFLSDFDKEQHRRLFPEPWQVAYVIDSQAHRRAVYHVVDNEWHRLEGYYVLKEMAHNEIVLSAIKTRRTRFRLAAFIVLLILLVGGIGWGYGWFSQIVAPPPESTKVSEPEREPPGSENEEGPAQTVDEREEPAAAFEIPSAEVPKRSAEYIVQRGDNLWQIAEKLWGAPQLFPLIASENDLDDPSFLPVGKILSIPELTKE